MLISRQQGERATARLSLPVVKTPGSALTLLVLAVLAGGCGDDDGGTTTAAKPPATTATDAPTSTAAPETAGCKPAEAATTPKPSPAKPRGRLASGRTWAVRFETNCGDFVVTLDTKRAPRTAASIAHLVRARYYDGITFHRIVPGFVIQAGDPEGTGQGGVDYDVVEAPPEDLVYTHGVVAMAKTELDDPGTSGSQFFVVTGDDAMLPPDYALAGRITSGLDVVDAIGAVPTDAQDQPVDPVVILKATLSGR